jgi:hypothetical protein
MFNRSQKEMTMKSTLFLLVSILLLSVAGFAQVGSVAVAPINGPTYQPYSNPQHADQHDLRPEQSLLGTNSVTSAHGERPLWEFGPMFVEPSLGDVARAYRKEHAVAEKAEIRWEQQGQ